MRFVWLLILCPALTFAATEPPSAAPAVLLLSALEDLAADPVVETMRWDRTLDARLFVGLYALYADPRGTVRRFNARLPQATRARLASRTPLIVDRLTRDEPYLQRALWRERRRLNPRVGRAPFTQKVREYYQIALAKLGLRKFNLRAMPEATGDARLIVALELMIYEGAHAPLAVPAARQILDVLEDSVETPGFFEETQSLDLRPLDDATDFARAYHEGLTLATREALVEMRPAVMTTLLARENRAVVTRFDQLSGTDWETSREKRLLRDLKYEGGSFLAEWARGYGITALARRVTEAREITARALRLRQFERTIRDGATPSCVERLARAFSNASSI